MPVADVRCSVPDSRVPLILAERIVVVVDDGAAVAADYPILERIVLSEAKRYPGGIAGLVIIPASARPPPEEVRSAIRETLANVGKYIRSICWYVEGSGFRGASQRAVLSGLVLLLKPPYPAHITSDLRAALGWSYSKAGVTEQRDLDQIVEQIRELRVSVDRKLLP